MENKTKVAFSLKSRNAKLSHMKFEEAADNNTRKIMKKTFKSVLIITISLIITSAIIYYARKAPDDQSRFIVKHDEVMFIVWFQRELPSGHFTCYKIERSNHVNYIVELLNKDLNMLDKNFDSSLAMSVNNEIFIFYKNTKINQYLILGNSYIIWNNTRYYADNVMKFLLDNKNKFTKLSNDEVRFILERSNHKKLFFEVLQQLKSNNQ